MPGRAVIDVTKHQGLGSLSGYPSWRTPSTTVFPLFPSIVADGALRRHGALRLRRLWDAFVLSDEQLAGVPGDRVHPEAGRWLASWDELA
jgi:hypothetical protein